MIRPSTPEERAHTNLGAADDIVQWKVIDDAGDEGFIAVRPSGDVLIWSHTDAGERHQTCVIIRRKELKQVLETYRDIIEGEDENE